MLILTYLLTGEFLVDKYLVRTKILLEYLECYKDTQMKAYNSTRLSAKLKSSDFVQYRNKIYFMTYICLPSLNTVSGVS